VGEGMSQLNEPWSLVEKERCFTEYLDLVDANGESLIGVCSPCREEGSNIDAHSDVLHRIVACVNACKGIPAEVLQRTDDGYELMEFLARRHAVSITDPHEQ
jgi:hypothetical protein